MFLRRTLLVVMLAAVLVPGAALAEMVTVFAAASLKNGLDQVAADFERKTGTKVTVSYAASSALAKQIEAGAPADLFFSADTDWMDHLAEKGLIQRASRVDLLGNRLVLIGAPGVTGAVDLKARASIPTLLGGGRLAVALVDAVPAGKYAKSALEALGLWPSLKDRLAQAENVRAALALVARGEAPLGVVYATDAAAEPKVTRLAIFPPSSHPPIIYPAALTNQPGSRAASFLRYLASSEAGAVFQAQGFTLLTGAS